MNTCINEFTKYLSSSVSIVEFTLVSFRSPLTWVWSSTSNNWTGGLGLEYLTVKVLWPETIAEKRVNRYIGSSTCIITKFGISCTWAECRATGFCPVLLRHYVRFFSDPISIVYMYVWNADIQCQFPYVQHSQLLCNCKCLFANKLTLQQWKSCL